MADENQSWVEKHRPESISEIQGNNTALKEIKEWAENWEPGDRAKLLVGPPGTGKTTTAYVMSDILGMPLNQMNASSLRTSDDIAEMASSITSAPVDGERQLVLLDEVDGWSTGGRINRDPMYDVLDDPPCPILLTANDEYDTPDGVTNRVDSHDFKLGKRSRRAKLNEIAEKEGLDLDERDMNKLAERPDLRSAINDLQTWSEYGSPPGDDGRTWERDDFDAIPDMLNGNKYPNESMTPDNLVLWLDQGVRQEFKGLETAVAYDCLSMADKWIGRAQSTRNYKWWKHAGEIARMVAEVRRTDSYSNYIQNLFPEWFRHTNDNISKENPSPEARVYKKLKKYDSNTFTFTGSYIEFKNTYLELLRDLDIQTRREMALAHRLEDAELEVLNIDKEEYQEWASGEDSSVQDYEAQSQSVLDF